MVYGNGSLVHGGRAGVVTLILAPSLTIVAAVGNVCRACMARWINGKKKG